LPTNHELVGLQGDNATQIFPLDLNEDAAITLGHRSNSPDTAEMNNRGTFLVVVVE
jgi:hypothetical protein